MEALKSRKGKIIIDFPCNYTVIYITKDGDKPSPDNITELTAFKFRDKRIFDTFKSKISHKPSTNSKKPCSFTKAFANFIDFIGSDIIVDHNATVDIDFIYNTCLSEYNKDFCNDYIDTLQISQKIYADLPDHDLRTIVNHLDYQMPLNSCSMTFLCYEQMCKDVIRLYKTVDDFKNCFNFKS